MSGWEIAILVLMVLNIVINLSKDGQNRKDKYSFSYAVIGNGISFFLMYKAGLFQ